MTAPLDTKTCLYCDKPLRGRTDKKFCDDACRNSHNNRQKLKSNFSNYTRSINNALLKNRSILEKLLPLSEENMKTTQEKLIQKGFLFKYHTHTYTNLKGSVYYFCYDYGYLPLNNKWYLIVRRKEGNKE